MKHDITFKLSAIFSLPVPVGGFKPLIQDNVSSDGPLCYWGLTMWYFYLLTLVSMELQNTTLDETWYNFQPFSISLCQWQDSQDYVSSDPPLCYWGLTMWYFYLFTLVSMALPNATLDETWYNFHTFSLTPVPMVGFKPLIQDNVSSDPPFCYWGSPMWSLLVTNTGKHGCTKRYTKWNMV